jgi:hypothetical protein
MPSCGMATIIIMSQNHLRLDISRGDVSFSAEGNADVVLGAYNTFREEVLLGPPPATAPKGPAKGQSANGKGSEQAGTGENVPLSAFIKAHPGKTQAEWVAVLTTWSHLNDGTSEFTREAVEKLWKKAGIKKAGNLAQALSDAEKADWLEKKGRGKYALTQYGIRHVLEELVPAEKG